MSGSVTIDVTGYSVAQDNRGADYIVRCPCMPSPLSRSSRVRGVACAFVCMTPARVPLQVFIVKVKLDEFSWVVYRRFSQFRDLGDKVRVSVCVCHCVAPSFLVSETKGSMTNEERMIPCVLWCPSCARCSPTPHRAPHGD